VVVALLEVASEADQSLRVAVAVVLYLGVRFEVVACVASVAPYVVVPHVKIPSFGEVDQLAALDDADIVDGVGVVDFVDGVGAGVEVVVVVAVSVVMVEVVAMVEVVGVGVAVVAIVVVASHGHCFRTLQPTLD